MSKIMVETKSDLFNLMAGGSIIEGDSVSFANDIDLQMDTDFPTSMFLSAGTATFDADFPIYIKCTLSGKNWEIGESYEVKEFGDFHQANLTCLQIIEGDGYCRIDEGSLDIASTGNYTIAGFDFVATGLYEGWFAIENSGTIDGNGHKVTGLYLNGTSSYAGFVSTNQNSGIIRDLAIDGNCHFNSSAYSGEVFGYNWGLISKCSASGLCVNTNQAVGGLGGVNKGLVEYCCCTATVICGGIYTAGLVALNLETGLIHECYSVGLVASGATNMGGLVALNTATVTDCFWNTETSGQATSASGTGLTTAQMQTVSTFIVAGWDFVEDWRMDTLFGHPQQRVFDAVIAGRSSAQADRFDSLTERFDADYDRFGVFNG